MAQALAAFARRPAGIALGLLLLALLLRTGTLGNPLHGFDEQFYLLVGDRMVQAHALPFVDIFDRKPLGLFLIAAAACLGPGDPLIPFQLLALAAATGTALLIHAMIRRGAGVRAAWGGAAVYLAWLAFLENDGAQAQVFMNAFMGVAGWLTARSLAEPRSSTTHATVAMLAAGLALQIKPSCVFEAAFFGLALLWNARRDGARAGRLRGLALLWIAAGLLPTLAALAVYAALGQGHAFVFAQFVSPLAKLPDPAGVTRVGLLQIAAILALPAIVAGLAPRAATPQARTQRRFVYAWLAASLLGLAAWGVFTSPQYAAGALLPLAVAAGYGFESARARWFPPLVALLGLAASEIVTFEVRRARGGPVEAALLARAAQPRRGGCLFVYDGPPALYRLTHSCLLSHYVFPGHLNMANEASARSLGVDPLAEIRRILAQHPETIVDAWPGYRLGNCATHAVLAAALARDYRLEFALTLPHGNRKLVYRRTDALLPLNNGRAMIRP